MLIGEEEWMMAPIRSDDTAIVRSQEWQRDLVKVEDNGILQKTMANCKIGRSRLAKTNKGIEDQRKGLQFYRDGVVSAMNFDECLQHGWGMVIAETSL